MEKRKTAIDSQLFRPRYSRALEQLRPTPVTPGPWRICDSFSEMPFEGCTVWELVLTVHDCRQSTPEQTS